ncbi:MAG TPA: carboxypeptidase regulatory-like domain-containing protein [bacterium]|nr:carboxypeptidase regulatory-like domain-containing protein [bacterium]
MCNPFVLRHSLLSLLALMLTLFLAAPLPLAAQDASGSPAVFVEKGSISGRVTGIDSSLIGVASVTAWTNDPMIAEWGKGFALVDSLFSFRIDSLAPGDYYVTAEAPGYLPQYFLEAADWTSATLVTVKAGEVTPGIRFNLKPGSIVYGGSISGRVTGPDGLPLPYVTITASTRFAPDSGKYVFMEIGYASSDEMGNYLLANLPENDYYIRADYWNSWFGQTLWYPQAAAVEGARPVTVTDYNEVSGIDFTFTAVAKTGRIAGKVVDALGHPLANAGIQIMAAPDASQPWNRIWLYATTGDDGLYEIAGVPNGVYVAYCWAQSGWEYAQLWWPDASTMEAAKYITLSDAAPEWQADFTLPLTPGTAVLSGRVANIEGRFLANASIQISAAENDYDAATGHYFYAWAVTDSNGYYRVDRLSHGRYIAYAAYWEGESFGQSWFKDADSLTLAQPIALQDGEKRGDIDFTLRVHPIYGAIVGTVTDAATGQPIPRAYVQVNHPYNDMNMPIGRFAWWPYYQITDDQGRFIFETMSEGTYQLAVYANGGFAWYPDAIVAEMGTPVKVVGGQKTEANFALALRQEGRGAISGQVQADYGYIAMRGADASGSTRLESVLGGYTPEIAIVMAKPAVTIMLWPYSEQFYTAVTTPDGQYTLKGVPAGEYYLSCFAPGHMLRYYKETFDPAEAVLVKVESDQETSGIDFTLQPNPWFFIKEGDGAGRNALSANISGTISDANGQGVAGAAIYLLDSAGQPVAWTTSDQKGQYEILGVTNGQYYLQAGKTGFATTFNGNASSRDATVPLVAASGLTQVNITLTPAGSTDVDVRVLPEKIELLGNYPNPFNPETSIHFALPSPMQVTLTIYDRLGRQVRQLENGLLPEGEHQVLWDGRDAFGQTMSSGLYFYRLATPAALSTGKMVLMR